MAAAAPSNPPPSSRRAPPSTQRPKKRAQRRVVGKIGLRLILALTAMAGLPLIIGILLAISLAWKSSDLFYNPNVARELEASISIYPDFVRALKGDMKHRADAIAAREPLRAAAAIRDSTETNAELKTAFDEYGSEASNPNAPVKEAPLVSMVSLEVYPELDFDSCLERFAPGPHGCRLGTSALEEGEGAEPVEEAPQASMIPPLGHVDRGAPLDGAKECILVQCKPLGPDPEEEGKPQPAMLVATFATERARIERRLETDKFLQVYKTIEARRAELIWLNVAFFSALLFVTIVVAGAYGFFFARSVSRRVLAVADVAEDVAQGDLEVRVPAQGDDEVGELAIVFNRMLGEVARSRARIEYLQRIGAWQEMARRLAHEIKNPLTPIQLAVEECHAKYNGDDPRMRKLLDTTLEIVTEEVGTLRRLVSEFSDFARLPRAALEPEPLDELMKELAPALERLGMGTDQADVMRLTPSGGQAIPVKVIVEPFGAKDAEGAPILAVDKQMLRKSVDNLVRNAVQAIRAAGKGWRVVVHATVLDGARVAIDVDDDGPGVPAENRDRVFDPYFTTRTEGTGLGLAIVKKIVIEHGGSIVCDVSPMKGARFRIVLPTADSEEGKAALEEAEKARG